MALFNLFLKTSAPPSPAPAVPAPAIVPSARAARRMGNYFDEFSRGMNPFGFIPTFGVADASAGPEAIAALFDRFSIVKVRGVYTPAESAALSRLCAEFSGLPPRDFSAVFRGDKKGFAGGAPVLNDKRFWPYATNRHVTAAVQKILGAHAIEFGSSVAAHYSARGIHRDYRLLCEKEGSAYNISKPEKRIVRVLHYCAPEHMQGGMLGIIPFSHDERAFAEQSQRIGLKKPIAWFDTHRDELAKLRTSRNFAPIDEIDRHVVWVATDPGDVLITNSAMLHCGEHMLSPRYFFVSSYADINQETLPLARAAIRSDTARDYLHYLAGLGFGGASSVLAALNKDE